MTTPDEIAQPAVFLPEPLPQPAVFLPQPLPQPAVPAAEPDGRWEHPAGPAAPAPHRYAQPAAGPYGPQHYGPPRPGPGTSAVGYPAAGPYGPPGVGYPVPQAYAAVAYHHPATPSGTTPSDALHWIVPVGRSWQSVVAGYLGLLSPLVVVLAPFAIGFGIWALQRARSGGHGRGRAVTGIVGGILGLVVVVALANGGVLG